MADLSQAKYAQLRQQEGYYVVTLLDEHHFEVGHGYKGPTLKRAEQDLKYWTKTKGLQELSK